MGAGIAQLACQSGYRTLLHDPDPRALAGGLDRTVDAIERGVKRGRWSVDESVAAIGRLEAARELERLAGCELVIEAAPEDLGLKRRLFGTLSALAGEAVLATNTSSLSVAAIAEGASSPDRIVGMHFFNPPAAMRLVEVVAGEASSPDALALAAQVARAMGRTPVAARDVPGFVGNRCARPFTLESLRMLDEGVADHEQIDRVCRLGGGFRMGPFELMDLVGLDVNYAVARSLYEQSGELSRWRPSPIQERLVAEGRLGRKTGRGFYSHPDNGEHRPADPALESEPPVLSEDGLVRIGGRAAPEILWRVCSQIVNEGCFALGEGVASRADIDKAMRLGFNWPLGPLEWGERMGFGEALETLERFDDEEHRPAPLLRELAAGGPVPA